MTAITTLDHRYDAAAPWWQARMGALGYFAAYRGLVATHAPRKPSRVLDAGCGAGDFAAAWRAERGDPLYLTLLDPSRGMLDRAMARHGTATLRPLAVAGALDDLLPCPKHDVILCAHVLEHLAAPMHGLHRMRSALAPGGLMILVVSKPHWCNRLIWLRWRHQSLAPARMRALVAGAGLMLRDDHGFPTGPPSRTSHAYIITHP
jgi:ubiquinone/menaquinone biosynthesis C-methylase UbiE